MSEILLTDSEALALAGTTDSDTDFEYHSVGQSTYYLDGFRQRHRVLTILQPVNALRVYKDGDLTFGVRPGKYFNGDSEVAYAGASAQALTNNDTNYIYLTAAGTLTVNITGFPTPSVTPHIPLATILTASGEYAHDDITDYRSKAIFQVCGGYTQFDAEIYTVPMTDMRRFGDLGLILPNAGDGTNLAIRGAFSVGSPYLASTDADNDTITEYARFLFALPPEYVDGQTVTLRIRAAVVAVMNVSAEVDVECYESNREGGIGADLCETAAQSINSTSFADKAFTITPAGLAAGDLLDIRIKIDLDDQGGSAGDPAIIGSVQFLLDIKG